MAPLGHSVGIVHHSLLVFYDFQPPSVAILFSFTTSLRLFCAFIGSQPVILSPNRLWPRSESQLCLPVHSKHCPSVWPPAPPDFSSTLFATALRNITPSRHLHLLSHFYTSTTEYYSFATLFSTLFSGLTAHPLLEPAHPLRA